MHRYDFLKQAVDAITNNLDVAKVKVTYTNGEVLKFTFDQDEEDTEEEDTEEEDEDEDDNDEEEEEEEEEAE